MVELIPESYLTRLDLAAIFPHLAPLEVDLGCGDGSFLTSLARQRPEHNFLGIERLAGRVRSSLHKTARLENVRILRIETAYAVRYLLPKDSVHAFHLLFPDPWPKRRHHRRRVVTEDFLEGIATALSDGGTLRIVTDQLDYFEQIRALTEHSTFFEIAEFIDDNGFPNSTFERKFRNASAEIYRLKLRKTSPVR